MTRIAPFSPSAIITTIAAVLICNFILSTSGEYRDRYRVNPRGQHPQHKLHSCEQSSCYPQTGNLLIGRESQLEASSTCGLHEPTRYCIVSHLEDRKKCFWCNSKVEKRPNLNHNISNIVYRFFPGTRIPSWWQSENGKENVHIQFDLEAEFHFTHLIMTFKTFRPAAMLIERSYDFGKTWQVYRYFAHHCAESFPGIPETTPENLTDVVCESRYSGVSPSTDGEVIYRVLIPNAKIDNPYSERVQNLLKITNLRINFTKLHTLGDDLLDKREEIQEKYYYAISHMIVRGSCSCYGHANRCLPLPGTESKPDMVHGRCECTHNTKGRNCEKCEDFFNDFPWGPAVGKQTHACRQCNCNNHATSCHFDSAVYETSGRVSGGVCDGCRHNTTGIHCEQCKPFFYRDPLRDIQDPEVCQPCDCDPYGSLDGGICDSITDNSNNLIAGSCHCKTNVEGRRCDSCKGGFWNFTMENPDGCQPCTCHISGTIHNQGCDVWTGECTCKRYVTGKDCNQCLPQHWGLSEKQDGCAPCNCDPGGSYNNDCDVITGQCKCRNYMTGLTCNIPKQQYFTASLDFLLYEAEDANGSPNCQVVIREPYRDGRPDSWTGTGFMKATEGSTIEFNIDDIRTSALYDPVIRYEPLQNLDWEDVEMRIVRTKPIDATSLCSETRPGDDVKRFSLPAHNRSVVIERPICLEAGEKYKVILEFRRSQYNQDTPTASVLIDSIVLVPRVESIPWFNNGSPPGEQRLREYQTNCQDLLYSLNPQNVPEVCRQHYNSISAYIFNGGQSCQCDPTGSVSKLCKEYGGICSCKQNVVGRRCDTCAPGTYGFGPEGCKACDCNSIGALDNFCNVTTGQCKCRANTYGRECNQCRTGFWNFPDCQRCDCNGHADICDARTGACIDCREYTEGHTCDRCVDGYYGDPRLNVDIPCRQCPCPGVAGSNHSFADTCMLDPTRDVVCHCKEGYAGARCDVCVDNYYGNPEVPGGSCNPCECNDKIDLLRPGNCDPHTGKCKQCLYETTGDHCEICKPSYFRNSPEEMCRECVCNVLGTNQTAGPCNPESGKCSCYSHVVGQECDQCEDFYWKIASGSGCEPCNCDPVGSMDLQCHRFYGQCSCHENFGGLQCNECKANYWGNPKANQCMKCDCDPDGSQTLQCDRKTGACQCHPGIGGHQCNVCDRGYLGTAPACIPCGECFDNWDRTLQEYKNLTLIEIERAKDINKVGATGAYTKEFDDIQDQLHKIEKLLNKSATIDLGAIEKTLSDLDERINNTKTVQLKELDEVLANTSRSNGLTEVRLKNLKVEIENLKNKTEELKRNATNLQEQNVQGALDIVRNAKVKADAAVKKAKDTNELLKYVEVQCHAAENLINGTEKSYEEKQKKDNQQLEDIGNNIRNLTESLPNLNKLVCDSKEFPCDPVCGGAKCGFCGGGVSCDGGAKSLADTAYDVAVETEALLKAKEDTTNDFIRNISSVNTTIAKEAELALNKTLEANQTAFVIWSNVTDNKNKIEGFLKSNATTPDDMTKIIDQIMQLDIKLHPDEIKNLTKDITDTVEMLTNIEPIIDQTRGNLAIAKQLKEDAEAAKKKAEDLKATADNVRDALVKSKDIQKEANEAITSVYSDYQNMTDKLTTIDAITNSSSNQIDSTSTRLTDLDQRLKDLQKSIQNSRFTAQTLKNDSINIEKKVNQTQSNWKQLQDNYETAEKKLNVTLTKVQDSHHKAKGLHDRALNLTATVTKAQEVISKLQGESAGDDLDSLSDEISQLLIQMGLYTNEIEKKADYFKTCV
ncbi:Laminin EGF domain [Popillia japonica]|uniref:Laminin EGF domain n=1 Tax=Popillia japonica TaxID=7064 RepID=A0AAW1MXT0_POPJA